MKSGILTQCCLEAALLLGTISGFWLMLVIRQMALFGSAIPIMVRYKTNNPQC